MIEEKLIEKLLDPNFVHINTLLGTIAKLTDEQVKHLYPHLFDEDGEKELDEIKDYLWPNQTGLPNQHRNALVAIKARENLLSGKIGEAKQRLQRKVGGALKSAIAAHGPITKQNHISAAKRIAGLLIAKDSKE